MPVMLLKKNLIRPLERHILGIFTVVKIPRDSKGYGIIPWFRCNPKHPVPSKLVP